ncbi:putative DNA polymerase POLD1 [Emiliania huxleyi CCMP1516]|uniref:DNA polymerase n=2 Tax=Emiliania huxleyi TaxID=2903 RepID=A0A0D3KDP7_EMIH1|nr:putative DNA polymerase POLD1 [Emiliania huxleyi CCMP1516]EOD33882.1 putative DNA polymerase POLD1 [Emiliania huxleyi CCMP1516]|eukprot:XP_005786311.1 putative DNA polymerase POLD1 [Emiliania huxleyi CCMP1516]
MLPEFATPLCAGEQRAASVRFYGVTKGGNSVTAHVHGFLPYFFVRAWPGFKPEDCEPFRQKLNARLKSGKEPVLNPVVMVRPCQKKSIMNYSFGQQSVFLRIVTCLPSLVSTARRLLEQGMSLPSGGAHSFETYESNWAYVMRFMVDRDIQGMSWLSLTAGKWRARPWTSEGTGHVVKKATTSQLEADLFFSDLVAHQPEGEWLGMAPMRILSFDIECAGRPGVFPDATQDPVIQIANHVCLQGETKPRIKNIFTLDTCSAISGAQVLPFEKEAELLAKWQQFLVASDADIITGYNIANFDLPYLLLRAETLKVGTFPYLGRIKGMKTRVKDKMFQSKQTGTRESKEINIEGRVQFDMLQVLQRDHKLSSYSLNSVCAHFLGEQKEDEDVHHSIISELQAGNADTRRRLAVYCLKDAYLPQRLLQKLMCLINYSEMARVCGVPLNYLLTRGQQIKVMSQLYRKAKTVGCLLPAHKQGEGDKYEGATVIEPKKGFYREPILEELLGARKKAKADMKAEKAKGKDMDPLTYAVYDGRQLALKVSANSVYGFTGAQVGQLPCLEISSSVTGFGRQMIEETKEHVEANYNVAKGYEHDAVVIYGDTDSVMIKFGTDSLAEAMRLGEEAAARVTQTFIQPIKLEFEKCYHPYLLMNKKRRALARCGRLREIAGDCGRYAGLLWTSTAKHDYMDCKGIETVRRDNCELVKDVVDTSLRNILIEGEPDKAISHVGDRIPYVMVKGAAKAKAWEKAEDPIFVLDNNIPLDTDWYLEHQLSEPIKRLFDPLVDDVKLQVLSGEHTRKIKKVMPTTGGLMGMVTVSVRCLGCRAVLKSGGALCANCTHREAEVYMEKLRHLSACEKRFWQIMVQCQRITGDNYKDVLGIARDSPIYYQMKKVQKDLNEARETISRFGVPV